jgi:hypothetical protein
MGQLLATLLSESASGPAATFATFATIQASPREKSQESQESQGLRAQDLRARLLNAASAEYADPDLIHRLSKDDVDACEGLPESVLRAYLRALEDEAERMAGRVPRNETEAILCARCGPVWAPPAVAAVLPMVNGIPRALGCPWCHVRKAGKPIPRPRITCGACIHYLPDRVNPEAGAGHCGLQPEDIHRMHWPMQRHACSQWQPKDSTP